MASEGQVPREPQIPRALNELSTVTDSLEGAFGKLVNRLEPAMADGNPATGTEKIKEAPGRAVITGNINAVTERLAQLLVVLAEVNGRLEL